MPSSPPNLTVLAWDFVSAAPSWNRMAAACGLPTTLRVERAFTLLYPARSRREMTPAGAPTVFVIDDDALVRAAIQGMLKSVGLRADAFASPQEFARSQRPDGPSCLVLDIRLPGVNGLDFQ